jgi:hypothetical protein
MEAFVLCLITIVLFLGFDAIHEDLRRIANRLEEERKRTTSDDEDRA